MHKKKWMAWLVCAAVAVTSVGQTGVLAADFTDETVSVTEETATDESGAAAGTQDAGETADTAENAAETEASGQTAAEASEEAQINSEEETAEAEISADVETEEETSAEDSEEMAEPELFNAGEEEAVSAGEEAGDKTYDYNWPLSSPGEDCILPNWGRDISMSCWVWDNQTGTGEDVDVPITKVLVTSSGTWDEDGNQVQDGKTRLAINGNENDGWSISAYDWDNGDSYGWVNLSYTYNALEDDESEKTGELTVYINSDVYEIQPVYRDNSEMMQTNDSMTVETSLFHQYIGENGHESGYISDYSLQIRTDEEDMYDTNLISAEANGKEVTITSKSESGDTNVLVTAYVNGEAVADIWLYVNVQEGYYLIQPSALTEGENSVNPNIGEELDLKEYGPTLYWYDSDHPDGAAVQAEYRTRLAYDSNVWKLKDDTGDELPTLVRTRADGTWVQLIAERQNENGDWEELTRRQYDFNGLEYDLDFTYSYGNRDQSSLFNGEPLTLTLKTAEGSLALPDSCTVQWTVEEGTDDGNISTDAADLVTKGKYQATVTANPDKLDRSVCVRATACCDGEEIASTETWLYVCNPEYSYDFPAQGPAESDLLPGWTYDIPSSMNCWVCDPNHPGGEDVDVTIKNAEVTVQGTEWKDDELVNDPSANVIKLEKLQEGGWRITAVDGGSALVTLTYKDVEDNTEKTQDIQFYVSNERYSLEISLPHSGLDRMQKDETIEASVSLLYQWLDEEGYEQSKYLDDWKLEFSRDENGYVSYDTNGIDAEISGTGETKTIKITSKDYTDTNINVKAFVTDEDGNYNEVGWNYFSIHVYPTVYVIEPGALDENPCVGEELDLNGKLSVTKYFTLDDGSKDQVTVDTFTYRLAGYDEEVWEVKAGTEKDPIPVLIRKMPWDTSIRVVAVDEEGNEFDQDYWLDESYYDVDFKLSYGEVAHSEKYRTTADLLTDVPLTVTLDSEAFNKVEGYRIEWILFGWNDQTDERADLNAAKLSETSFSVTLQGITPGVQTWVGAEVYQGEEYVGGSGVLLTTTTCAARGHEWSEWTTTKAVSCTEDGISQRTCLIGCGATETRKIAALGHDYKNWTVASKATVFTAEVQTGTCSRCGATTTRNNGEKLKATIKFNASSLKLKKGQKTKGFKVTFANGDSVKSWSGYNKKLIKVSGKANGTCTITALKKTGNTTITVKLKSGLSKKIKVTVQKNTVKTTSLKLNKTKVSLKKKKTFKLTATVAPFTSGEKVTWKSSNSKIATVDKNGKIKGVKKGTCTITAKSGSKTAKVKVTVK